MVIANQNILAAYRLRYRADGTSERIVFDSQRMAAVGKSDRIGCVRAADESVAANGDIAVRSTGLVSGEVEFSVAFIVACQETASA